MPVEYKEEHIAFLKRLMSTRFPKCQFTREDYADIMRETGLSEELVELWETGFQKCVREQELRNKIHANDIKMCKCQMDCRAYERMAEQKREHDYNMFTMIEKLESERMQYKERVEYLEAELAQAKNEKAALIAGNRLSKFIADAIAIVEYLETQRENGLFRD